MTTASPTPNRLYFGDNLDILRQYVADETVDLIYLDPPFNSNATYNVLFRERSGEESAAQITAFEDTWHWGWESEIAFQDVVTRGPDKVGSLLSALRQFLGQNDMMAYLTMMAQRMIELHRVLKPTGSIYLHCDRCWMQCSAQRTSETRSCGKERTHTTTPGATGVYLIRCCSIPRVRLIAGTRNICPTPRNT